jgi:hypothetical protein
MLQADTNARTATYIHLHIHHTHIRHIHHTSYTYMCAVRYTAVIVTVHVVATLHLSISPSLHLSISPSLYQLNPACEAPASKSLSLSPCNSVSSSFWLCLSSDYFQGSPSFSMDLPLSPQICNSTSSLPHSFTHPPICLPSPCCPPIPAQASYRSWLPEQCLDGCFTSSSCPSPVCLQDVVTCCRSV